MLSISLLWRLTSKEDRLRLTPTTIKAARPSTEPARLSLGREFSLALLPTATILATLGLVEAFSRQRLLFASLAASVFLIYRDPAHRMNDVRTLIVAQGLAVLVAFGTNRLLGAGYGPAAVAMVVAIAGMIALDALHPPAVSTALSFAFQPEPTRSLAFFGLALGLVVVFVFLQRLSLWLLTRHGR